MIEAEQRFTIGNFLRRFYVLLLLLLVLFSGLRFSDGSMLLAISKGVSVTDPVVANSNAQYVFDSPLKVFVLRHIPPNVTLVASFFLLLAVLPAIAPLLSKDRSAAFSSIAVLMLLPTLKLSFQNVGVGDGLMVFGLLLFLNSEQALLKVASLLTVSLWHPQQSVFMYAAIIIGELLHSRTVSRSTMTAGLIFPVSLICFLLHRNGLGFEYAGRWDFMKANAGAFLFDNLLRTPVFLLPLCIWALALEPRVLNRRRELRLSVAFGVFVYCLALFTTDLSRVFFLVMLPIFYYHAKITYPHLQEIGRKSCLALVIAAFCTPIASWSGLDIFLWPDLLKDFCKWGFFCLHL